MAASARRHSRSYFKIRAAVDQITAANWDALDDGELQELDCLADTFAAAVIRFRLRRLHARDDERRSGTS